MDRDPTANKRNNKLLERWRGWMKNKKGSLCRDKEDMGRDTISWRRLFRKMKAKVRKMVTTAPSQRFNYDGVSYALNFDDGGWQHVDEHGVAGKYCASAVQPALLETFKPGA